MLDYRLIIFILFLWTSNLYSQKTQLFTIPATQVSAIEIIPALKSDTLVSQKEFEASQLITLKEYKDFLSFLEQKWDENKALNYFPDSSICLAKEDYTAYLSDTIYEKYPVLGVSWENAMSFCIWRSRTDSLESSNHYYRLPNYMEYAAIRKLDSLNPQLELIKDDYSEWSLLSKDESLYFYAENQKIDYFLNYFYFADDVDPPAMRRKLIFGNNFHFKRRNVYFNSFSKYQNNGYHYVGFRLIKNSASSDIESSIYSSILKLYDYE